MDFLEQVHLAKYQDNSNLKQQNMLIISCKRGPFPLLAHFRFHSLVQSLDMIVIAVLPSMAYTETEISCWQNFLHWLHRNFRCSQWRKFCQKRHLRFRVRQLSPVAVAAWQRQGTCVSTSWNFSVSHIAYSWSGRSGHYSCDFFSSLLSFYHFFNHPFYPWIS